MPDAMVDKSFSTDKISVLLDIKGSLFKIGKMINLHLPEDNKEEAQKNLSAFIVRLKALYSSRADNEQKTDSKCKYQVV